MLKDIRYQLINVYTLHRKGGCTDMTCSSYRSCKSSWSSSRIYSTMGMKHWMKHRWPLMTINDHWGGAVHRSLDSNLYCLVNRDIRALVACPGLKSESRWSRESNRRPLDLQADPLTTQPLARYGGCWPLRS